MNTKFSFTLLAVSIVLIVTACAPAITDDAAPVAIAVPPADNAAAVVPVTGNSAPETARSEAQAPRLWSGEVFLSDNDTPDVTTDATQDLQNACISEDSLPRRYSGCVE